MRLRFKLIRTKNRLLKLLIYSFVMYCIVLCLQDSSEEDLFEGDLKFSKEQIQAALNGGARGLTKNRQWPGGIVYYTINTRK